VIDPRELEARGLYDPGAPNAAERLALLRFLDEHDATLDEMVAAHAAGHLVALAGEQTLVPAGSRYTLAEVASLAGTTPEAVERIRRAVNLAARVADLAVPFEVLVTAEVAAQAQGIRFEPAGRRMLKGFDEPVPLFSAERR
jgi:hypothetical protein